MVVWHSIVLRFVYPKDCTGTSESKWSLRSSILVVRRRVNEAYTPFTRSRGNSPAVFTTEEGRIYLTIRQLGQNGSGITAESILVVEHLLPSRVTRDLHEPYNEPVETDRRDRHASCGAHAGLVTTKQHFTCIDSSLMGGDRPVSGDLPDLTALLFERG